MVDTKPSWWFQSIWILVKLDHFTKFGSFGISQLVQEFFHQTVFSLLKWASSFISKSELALPNVPSLHQFCIQNRNRNATEPMDFVYENEFRLQRVGICVGPYVSIFFLHTSFTFLYYYVGQTINHCWISSFAVHSNVPSISRTRKLTWNQALYRFYVSFVGTTNIESVSSWICILWSSARQQTTTNNPHHMLSKSAKRQQQTKRTPWCKSITDMTIDVPIFLLFHVNFL